MSHKRLQGINVQPLQKQETKKKDILLSLSMSYLQKCNFIGFFLLFLFLPYHQTGNPSFFFLKPWIQTPQQFLQYTMMYHISTIIFLYKLSITKSTKLNITIGTFLYSQIWEYSIHCKCKTSPSRTIWHIGQRLSCYHSPRPQVCWTVKAKGTS